MYAWPTTLAGEMVVISTHNWPHHVFQTHQYTYNVLAVLLCELRGEATGSSLSFAFVISTGLDGWTAGR